MKDALQIIKQHPWASTFYFLYRLIWCDLLNVKNRYRIERQVTDNGKRINLHECIGYPALLTILIGIIFILILLLNAAYRKAERKFYLLLCVPIIAAMLILFISYLL